MKLLKLTRVDQTKRENIKPQVDKPSTFYNGQRTENSKTKTKTKKEKQKKQKHKNLQRKQSIREGGLGTLTQFINSDFQSWRNLLKTNFAHYMGP